jgi:hypothetical protein
VQAFSRSAKFVEQKQSRNQHGERNPEMNVAHDRAEDRRLHAEFLIIHLIAPMRRQFWRQQGRSSWLARQSGEFNTRGLFGAGIQISKPEATIIER